MDTCPEFFDRPAGRPYLRPVRGDPRQIVAFGGGGFSMERGNTLLDGYALGLARERSSGERPKLCFLPTAMRRRGPLHRPLLPRLRARALRADARVALPPRVRRRRPARAPAHARPPFRGWRLARVVASRPGARAHRVRWTDKRISRRSIDSILLGGAPGSARVEAPAERLSVVAA